MIAYNESRSTKEFIENMKIIDPKAIESDEYWWTQLASEIDFFDI